MENNEELLDKRKFGMTNLESSRYEVFFANLDADYDQMVRLDECMGLFHKSTLSDAVSVFYHSILFILGFYELLYA
jgi:hypothetical protein